MAFGNWEQCNWEIDTGVEIDPGILYVCKSNMNDFENHAILIKSLIYIRSPQTMVHRSHVAHQGYLFGLTNVFAATAIPT